MKKILLSLFAFMLSASAMNAQVLQQYGQVFQQNTEKKAPAKIGEGLEKDQKYVGNYGATSPYTMVGMPSIPGDLKAGTMISADKLKEFAGCKIVGMRFALGQEIGKTTAFLQETDDPNSETGIMGGSDDKATATLKYTDAIEIDQQQGGISAMNWNMVMFDKPYVIPADPKNIIAGFTYTQKSGSDDNASYPLLVGATTDGVTSFCLYGKLDKNTEGNVWAPLALNSSNGSQVAVTLCLQIIVQKDGGFPQDVVLVGVAANNFVKSNGKTNIMWAATNKGSEELEKYSFAVSVDGNELPDVLTPEEALGQEGLVFNADVQMPELTIGEHTLGIKVKSMNGGEPTGNLDDDYAETKFMAYQDARAHQYNLVEHFTSQYCTFCPYGYEILRTLQSSRNDIAWVAIHGDMSQTQTDEYTLEGHEGDYITSISSTGFPSANFNRYYLNDSQVNSYGSLALGLGYSQTEEAANMFSQVIDMANTDQPAFVRLDAESEFSAKDGKLTLTLKGTGVKGAAQLLKDNVITVYLTESGLSGRQLNNGRWIKNFEHDNVLRDIFTEPWGDEIVWNGDNFECVYDVDVPAECNMENLRVVAFISNPFAYVSEDGKQLLAADDITKLGVNQCVALDLKDGTTNSIANTVAPAENNTVVARYSIDGSKILAPAKGVNIVKMADGTARKVVIK